MAAPLSLRTYLRRLKDPRIQRNKRHLLVDIITMAVCAVIGGADSWEDVATFARRRREWFARFLELPGGIPSHHTFRRVFDRLDPVALQKGLIGWLHSVTELLGVRHVAIAPGPNGGMVEVACLLGGLEHPLPLGTMDEARPICNACTARTVWRADEE